MGERHASKAAMLREVNQRGCRLRQDGDAPRRQAAHHVRRAEKNRGEP